VSRNWLLGLVLIFICTIGAFAQATGGSLHGRVTDETGAALPGVTITAMNEATGFARTAVTAADGSYLLQGLPVGSYTVTTELAGFASLTTKSVGVNVATDRALNVTLKQGAVKEQITVTAEAPLIASEPSIGTVVSQKELENLPLNGRQFANLGSLAPGTTLSINTDPTKPGQLTIALNGGSGRNVNFLIDGGDNTDDTIGGALQNFNIDAVQEFKIQTMQYKAEYGRTSGGVLSVVTKSGTNEFEGSIFDFYRAKSLNSISESERAAGGGKQDYRRDQYGASLGGPIVKDRAHFFATYEKTKRNTNYTVNTGSLHLLPEFEGKSYALPFTDQLGTAKASVNVSPKQYLQLRYGYQKNSDIYGAGSLAAPDSLGTTTNKYSSILAGHTWQLGSDKLNEFLFQRTKFDNAIAANSDNPTIYYPSGVTRGQSVNTPQSTHQKKMQWKDDLSWSSDFGRMRNDFKAGINYIDEPTLAGDFTIGTVGQYTMLRDSLTSPVRTIIINGGFSGYNIPIKQYNTYFQDDIAVSRNLTINAGLRYDLSTGFDLDQTTNPNLKIVQAAADSGRYTDAWMQDFKSGGGAKLKNDRNNYSPRIGFTYDLHGDSKQVLRGGAGRYYDFPYINATILFPGQAVQSLFGPIYSYDDPNGIKNADGTFFRPGIDPRPPNQISGNLTPTDRSTRELASPTLATPYSDQLSLGYSTEINNNLGLNFEAVGARYRDIPFRFRANPIDAATGARRFAGTAVPANFRLWYGKGFADYKGINIGFHSRMGSNFEAQGFYTLSQSTGNILGGADEFRLTNVSYQPDLGNVRDMTINPFDPLCNACEGPLNTDARHRITLSGVYRAPYAINVSGIIRYHSGTPYTAWTGHDTNGDGYALDLVPGEGHVNNRRGPSFSQFDLRLAKEFNFGGRAGFELIGEVFNLFNAKNGALVNGDCDVNASGQCTNPLFGKATAFAGDPAQGEQRLAQLGARIRF